jgi:hypothetical protein
MTEDITEHVRYVLEGQSADYFIYPNASAFVAVGLEPEAVASTLDEMEKAGEVEREQLLLETPDKNGTSVGGGYRLIR